MADNTLPQLPEVVERETLLVLAYVATPASARDGRRDDEARLQIHKTGKLWLSTRFGEFPVHSAQLSQNGHALLASDEYKVGEAEYFGGDPEITLVPVTVAVPGLVYSTAARWAKRWLWAQEEALAAPVVQRDYYPYQQAA